MATPTRTRNRRMRQQIADAQAVAHHIGQTARVIVSLRRRVAWGRALLLLSVLVSVAEAIALAYVFLGTPSP